MVAYCTLVALLWGWKWGIFIYCVLNFYSHWHTIWNYFCSVWSHALDIFCLFCVGTLGISLWTCSVVELKMFDTIRLWSNQGYVQVTLIGICLDCIKQLCKCPLVRNWPTVNMGGVNWESSSDLPTLSYKLLHNEVAKRWVGTHSSSLISKLGGGRWNVFNVCAENGRGEGACFSSFLCILGQEAEVGGKEGKSAGILISLYPSASNILHLHKFRRPHFPWWEVRRTWLPAHRLDIGSWVQRKISPAEDQKSNLISAFSNWGLSSGWVQVAFLWKYTLTACKQPNTLLSNWLNNHYWQMGNEPNWQLWEHP